MTFEYFNDESGYSLKKTVSPEAQAKILARLGRAGLKIAQKLRLTLDFTKKLSFLMKIAPQGAIFCIIKLLNWEMSSFLYVYCL